MTAQGANQAKGPTMELVDKQTSYEVLDACFEVDKDQGCGFVDPIYPIDQQTYVTPFIDYSESKAFPFRMFRG